MNHLQLADETLLFLAYSCITQLALIMRMRNTRLDGGTLPASFPPRPLSPGGDQRPRQLSSGATLLSTSLAALQTAQQSTGARSMPTGPHPYSQRGGH